MPLNDEQFLTLWTSAWYVVIFAPGLLLMRILFRDRERHPRP